MSDILGPGDAILSCNAKPLCPLIVANTAKMRARGLLGTRGIVGAIWLEPCPSVHMIGMKYPIDVAVLDASGRVLRVATLRPWIGITWPIKGARITVESAARSFTQGQIQIGDVLAVSQ